MNTNALKRFAKEARIKLIDQISRKLEFVINNNNQSFLDANQKQLKSLTEILNQIGAEQLIENVAYTWFNRIVALRFMDANGYNIPKIVTPLQGMSNPEILQNALSGNIEADLNINTQRLNDLLDGKTVIADAHTEAYKMLLVASCNQWHTAMPFMFERISDYTELLLPDDLLSDYSIVADIRNGMSDEDCQQEEILGWLYQFYISDKKDGVFEGLKKNIKITAENIPAATQLFTPRWIVRYMVENTLGKTWMTLKPNSKLREHMPYYIEAPEGNEPTPIPEGIKGVTDITFLDPCQGSGHVLVYAFDLFTKIYEEEGYNTNEIPALILEHNLFGIDIDERAAQLAAFALTMKARSYYSRFLRKPVMPHVFALKNANFSTQEINRIIAKGLVPFFNDLEFDNTDETKSSLYKLLKDRAKKEKTELPANTFSVLTYKISQFENESYVLKYLNRTEKTAKNLPLKTLLEDENFSDWIWSFANTKTQQLNEKISLYNQFQNIGSLFEPTESIIELLTETNDTLNQEDAFEQQFKFKLDLAINQSEFLANKYHCVVTNPPYLGGGGMNASMKLFVEKYFPKSKSDLMACFMERGISYCKKNGKIAMINQQSWMFLSSYAALRPYLIDNFQFENMLHLGARTFPEIGGEVVQNTAFVLGNYNPISVGVFIRLTDFENAQLKNDKTLEAISNPDCGWFYIINQADFDKIPENPIAYWIDIKLINAFDKGKSISDHCDVKSGLSTGDNEIFLRYWYEVNSNKIFTLSSSIPNDRLGYKWFLYNKGGGVRKWFGNNLLVVNWENDGSDIRKLGKGVFRNESFYFKKGITWSGMSSFLVSYRLVNEGTIFDSNKGPMIFIKENNKSVYFYLSFLNSKISSTITNLLNPTVSTQIGDIVKIPLVNEILFTNRHETLSIYCTEISIEDWDAHEISLNFLQNELLKFFKQNFNLSLENIVVLFSNYWILKFSEILLNEQELNTHFANAFDVNNLDITVNKSEITILQEESKIVNDELFIDPILVLLQLLSYSVGCLFGRYSLNKPGLILANQGETLKDFLAQVTNPTFFPDEDNIIPVLDGEWFTDDIVGRFKVFLKAAFSEEHFEENLKYIEDTIGKDIRKYFVKDFYNDHIKRYKKRPIYWMFSSPKGHFKALIYMHRYQPDLCSKMLNDYLQAFISKLEAAKQTQNMLSLREDITAREKALAQKEVEKLEAMLKDCRDYEKTLFNIATQKISIDLDNGVKVNYQLFKEVLVPIKGLEKEEE